MAEMTHLSAGDPFPPVLPLVPLHGSHKSPLEEFLVWHTELRSSVHKHASALFARQAAISRVAETEFHRRFAWNRLVALQANWQPQEPPSSREKGKSRESPVSINDDSGPEAEGFANNADNDNNNNNNNNARTDRSGVADEDDNDNDNDDEGEKGEEVDDDDDDDDDDEEEEEGDDDDDDHASEIGGIGADGDMDVS